MEENKEINPEQTIHEERTQNSEFFGISDEEKKEIGRKRIYVVLSVIAIALIILIVVQCVMKLMGI